jgi:TPR repeat protein
MRTGLRASHLAWLAASAAACSRAALSSGEPRPPEAECQASGEPEACAAAAELYFDGKNGHPLDHARSFRYASAACEKGQAFACALVGYHHQDGLGTAWAPERAIAAYEKACAGGAGVGCYNLASMYFGGHGVVADEARATAYKARAKAAWQAACDGAAPRWCTNVAYLLREENEVGNRQRCLELDQRSCDHQVLAGCTEAVRDRVALGRMTAAAGQAELERLCGAGEPSACAQAGTALVAGEGGVAAQAGTALVAGEGGVAAAPARGVQLLVRGCEIGDKVACALAGIEYGRGTLVRQDRAAADRYMRLGCEHGYGLACLMMAQVRAGQDKFADAVGFAQRACQMGEGEACGMLSALWFEGRGVARDEAESLRWATEACRMGYGPSCRVLIEGGRELPVPPDMKARIYRDGCAAGSAIACQRAERPL